MSSSHPPFVRSLLAVAADGDFFFCVGKGRDGDGWFGLHLLWFLLFAIASQLSF